MSMENEPKLWYSIEYRLVKHLKKLRKLRSRTFRECPIDMSYKDYLKSKRVFKSLVESTWEQIKDLKYLRSTKPLPADEFNDGKCSLRGTEYEPIDFTVSKFESIEPGQALENLKHGAYSEKYKDITI